VTKEEGRKKSGLGRGGKKQNAVKGGGSKRGESRVIKHRGATSLVRGRRLTEEGKELQMLRSHNLSLSRQGWPEVLSRTGKKGGKAQFARWVGGTEKVLSREKRRSAAKRTCSSKSSSDGALQESKRIEKNPRPDSAGVRKSRQNSTSEETLLNTTTGVSQHINYLRK